jgi:hypothetical protein
MAPDNHKEKKVKSSIVRGVLIFAAGAGCATVVAGGGWYPYETNPVDYEQRLAKAAREIAEIGIYNFDAKKGVVYLIPSPASCTPTPIPDIMEGRAVNPIWLRSGFEAVQAWNEGRISGYKTIVKIAPPCMPQ